MIKEKKPNTAEILVVDDEAVVGLSCQRVLAEDGHHVTIALSGNEALQCAAERPFHVALLDLRIPGMGGLTILRHFRRSAPETEVIVITGYPTIENAKEAIRLGAFEFVRKPLMPRVVSEVVRRALDCRPWVLRKEV